MTGKKSRRRVDSSRQVEEEESESEDNYSDSVGSEDDYIVGATTDTSGKCRVWRRLHRGGHYRNLGYLQYPCIFIFQF